MELITHWISQYGYLGIFFLLVLGIVGLPVPDETLLTFAGFMIYQRHLHPLPTFLAAFFGSACGITVSYGIGRSLGVLVIHRFGSVLHITQDRIDWVHKWFERVGTWALLMGYFIPGVRHLTAIAAGGSKLRPLVFGLFAYTGACLWVATFLLLGYFLGDRWKQVEEQIQSHLDTTTAIMLGLLALYLLFRYRSKWIDWLRR